MSRHGTKHEETLLMNPTPPVKLTPSWEDKNLTNEELNFEGVIDGGKPPRDKGYLVYIILMVHGLGTLIPWNMFINAKEYFEDYKLKSDDDETIQFYRSKFMTYLTLASQIPNLIFCCINAFFQIGGSLTTRIVFSILVEVVIFIGTVVLAMMDTTKWTGVFFWITIGSVIILNTSNGIYQSSVYGVAANLPMKYSNAVVIGSNVSGTLTALISILSLSLSPSIRTSAIYYFITALFILLICFDTYFALPLLRFYRYHDKMASRQKQQAQRRVQKIPYLKIFCKTFPQLFNVFFVFFVTLTIFPNIQSMIVRYDPAFVVPEKYYMLVTCFLVFNFFAMLGSLFPMLFKVPGPKWLFLPVLLRVFLIPAFMFCNYQPMNVTRALPVLIHNDWAQIGLGIVLGLTSGYYSSLAMMYAPRCVDPEHAPVAGMMAATALILGVVLGLNFSIVIPIIVEQVSFPYPY